MYYVSYLAPRQTKSYLLEPVLDDHKRSFPRHASQLMEPANKPFSSDFSRQGTPLPQSFCVFLENNPKVPFLSDYSPQGNILKEFLCITHNGHSFLQSLLEEPLNNDNLEQGNTLGKLLRESNTSRICETTSGNGPSKFNAHCERLKILGPHWG